MTAAAIVFLIGIGLFLLWIGWQVERRDPPLPLPPDQGKGLRCLDCGTPLRRTGGAFGVCDYHCERGHCWRERDDGPLLRHPPNDFPRVWRRARGESDFAGVDPGERSDR